MQLDFKNKDKRYNEYDLKKGNIKTEWASKMEMTSKKEDKTKNEENSKVKPQQQNEDNPKKTI